MKSFNVLSIFLSLVLIGLSIFFQSKVAEILERLERTADFNQKIYLKADSYEASVNAGLLCAGIILFLLIAFIANISKVKTKTAKSIGILGLVVTILMLAFNVFVVIGPKIFGFAEFGYIFTSFGAFSLICSIVLLGQIKKAHQDEVS